MNNKKFNTLFVQLVCILGIETVAAKLKISKLTAQRWFAGKSAPHPLGRVPVFTAFL